MRPTIIANPEASTHPAGAGNNDVFRARLVTQVPVHLYLDVPLQSDCREARGRAHTSED